MVSQLLPRGGSHPEARSSDAVCTIKPPETVSAFKKKEKTGQQLQSWRRFRLLVHEASGAQLLRQGTAKLHVSVNEAELVCLLMRRSDGRQTTSPV